MKVNLRELIVIMTLGIAACGQVNTKNSLADDLADSADTNKLIPIDFNDTNYIDRNELKEYVKDSTTPTGWTIKYLVKNNATNYNDVYIQCSKGGKIGLYLNGDLSNYRRGFLPEYVGETDTHLFLWHRCATDCQALAVMRKDSAKFVDYFSVVSYDLQLGQILYSGDDIDTGNVITYRLVDLKKNKEHRISLNGICGAVKADYCIDTVMFSNDKVIVKALLSKTADSKQEMQTVTCKL